MYLFLYVYKGKQFFIYIFYFIIQSYNEMENTIKQFQNDFSEAIKSYCSQQVNQGQDKPSYLKKIKQYNLDSIKKQLGTSINCGLSPEKVEQNTNKYGQNKFLKRKSMTFKELFMEALCDETLIILIIAAIVSIIAQYFFGEDKSRFWVDGVSILFAVLICSIVGAISNYQKQKQFQQLDQLTQLTYKYDVIRNGIRKQIHRSEVVTGDIIYLSIGMQIPADCILLKAIDVIVDESSVTGQSVELMKNTIDKCNVNGLEDSPLMISGSTVITGEGAMMAVVVGRNSHNGKNFEMLFSKQEQKQDTPLEEKLSDMAEKIGYLGLVSGIAIVVILVVRLVISDVVEDGFDFSRDIPKVISYLIIGIAVLVAAIPQGLPLAVTLTLAFSMKQMHQQNILVRKLASCQTMGSSNYICTDKTGTITSNQMRVSKIITKLGIQNSMENFNQKYINTICDAICINSNAIIQPYKKGSQTEIALLSYVKVNLKANPSEIRNKMNDENTFIRLPFNSMRKRMTTGIDLGSQQMLYTSGASQRILQCSSRILNPQTGNQQSIDNQKVLRQIQNISSQGMRVVGIAYKKLGQSKMKSSVGSSHKRGQIQSIQKQGFILLGMFGIQDPPRQQSAQAIQKAYEAGIKVIMVTGDNSLTANKIAREVHIIRQNHQKSMQGAQFINKLQQRGLMREGKQLNQDGKEDKQIQKMRKVYLDNEQDKRKFDQVVDGLAVLSRSRPQHKYILVDALIKRGNVVGVTGDGSNDAPALKRASVGLAMGKTGTQAAKNSSDIVILDDKFDSIVRAIVWGRNVFNSIRKFLQFQLTINLLLIFITLISSALIRQSVFTAVQLLWFNLIMDSLAALALAAQPPNEKQLLKQKPSSTQDSLLTMTMVKHILGQSIWHLILVISTLFTGFYFIPEFADEFDAKIGSDLQAKYYNGEPEGTIQDGRFYTMSGEDQYKVYFEKYGVYSRHLTIVFNLVVFLQIFNFFCCRKIKDQLNLIKGLCSSLLFWFIIIAIVVIQVLIIQYGSVFFGLYSYGLNLVHWLICIGAGFTTVIVSIFLRMLCCFKPEKQQEVASAQENKS